MTFAEMTVGLITAKTIRAAAAVLLSFLGHWIAPVAHFMAAALILTTVDTMTGIGAAKAKGEKITSFGMRRAITKIVNYMLAILMATIVQQVYFPHAPVTYLVSSYIGLTEFKSIIENVSTRTGTNLRDVINVINAIRKIKK